MPIKKIGLKIAEKAIDFQLFFNFNEAYIIPSKNAGVMKSISPNENPNTMHVIIISRRIDSVIGSV